MLQSMNKWQFNKKRGVNMLHSYIEFPSVFWPGKMMTVKTNTDRKCKDFNIVVKSMRDTKGRQQQEVQYIKVDCSS